MGNLNSKNLILIFLFLLIISSLQIILIPFSKSLIQRFLFLPLPEESINKALINICERDISKSAHEDSIIGYLCSRK